MNYLMVFLGGGIGAMFRYGFSKWFNYLFGNIFVSLIHHSFPTGTFIVNITGCLVIGILSGIASHISLDENLRLFLFIGLLGGYTTFSSFGFESVNLFKYGAYGAAFIYILASNVIGLFLAFIGFYASHHILAKLT